MDSPSIQTLVAAQDITVDENGRITFEGLAITSPDGNRLTITTE